MGNYDKDFMEKVSIRGARIWHDAYLETEEGLVNIVEISTRSLRFYFIQDVKTGNYLEVGRRYIKEARKKINSSGSKPKNIEDFTLSQAFENIACKLNEDDQVWINNFLNKAVGLLEKEKILGCEKI